MPDDPLGYAEISDVTWNRDAARTAQVALRPDMRRPTAIVVSGPCPRCAHDMVFDEPLFAFYGLDDGAGDALIAALAPAAPTVRDVVVICTCAHHHPGQAPDIRGCGASWVLHVDWTPS